MTSVASPTDAERHEPTDQRRSSPRHRRRLRSEGTRAGAAVFVVTLLLSFAYLAPVWTRDPATTWIGDVGDPEQNQWFLAWLPYAIGHGLNPFLPHHVLYPSGANLMWNTSVLFPALAVSPITVLFGPTVAYNIVLLLSPPTAALAAYCAIRRWTSLIAAAIGGVLFAFCPFFLRQADAHLHLVVLAFIPLTLLALDEMLVRQRWRAWKTGSLLALASLGQFFTSEEMFAFNVLVAAIGVVLLVVSYRSRILPKLRYVTVSAAIAVVAFVAVAAYPLWVQFRGPLQITHAIHVQDMFVTDLANTVVPVGQWLPWLSFSGDSGLSQHWSGNSGEWNGYLGLPLLLIVVVAALWSWRRPVTRLSVALLAVVMLLSLGPALHVGGDDTGITLPWKYLQGLPLWESALPNRLAAYADLFAAILVALFVDQLASALRRRPAWMWATGFASVGLIAASWAPVLPQTTTVPTPQYFTASGEVHELPEGSVAVILPFVDGELSEHAELWQARAGLPVMMPEGYLIVPGPHHGEESATYQALARIGSDGPVPPALAAAVRAQWKAWGVRAVIVGPGKYDQQVAAAIVSQVLGGAAPRWTGGVAVFTLDP